MGNTVQHDFFRPEIYYLTSAMFLNFHDTNVVSIILRRSLGTLSEPSSFVNLPFTAKI